jgi:phosphoglycerate dehydrogenase-like enzyme
MVRSVIAVHPNFEAHWSFAADHFHALWAAQGPVEFYRLEPGDDRPLGAVIAERSLVTRLAGFGVRVTDECLDGMTALEEATFGQGRLPEGAEERLTGRGVRLYRHKAEGFWGQSVAEFGLTLTLCGLRRVPQLHHQILTDLSPWNYAPAEGVGRPGARAHQFGDDPNFTSGTVAGKRVRVVGAGNIASRYASFCHFMGADVAAWDPFAPEPAFHRAGARREWHLSELARDAEIFAPMVPLTDSTRGLVTAELINALPKGCLVVLVTRAGICDVPTLRARVLADELALAADVFDIEPLPLDDPLLGRHNVVHTPHNAGRTADANRQFASDLAAQFVPRGGAA